MKNLDDLIVKELIKKGLLLRGMNLMNRDVYLKKMADTRMNVIKNDFSLRRKFILEVDRELARYGVSKKIFDAYTHIIKAQEIIQNCEHKAVLKPMLELAFKTKQAQKKSASGAVSEFLTPEVLELMKTLQNL